MNRCAMGIAGFACLMVGATSLWAACNAPNVGLVTLTLDGPEYVGVGTTNDYTLTFSPSSVDTNGGTFAWPDSGFTVVGSDTSNPIKLVAPATPSTSATDKKTIRCEFSKDGWSSAAECSAQKKIIVVKVDNFEMKQPGPDLIFDKDIGVHCLVSANLTPLLDIPGSWYFNYEHMVDADDYLAAVDAGSKNIAVRLFSESANVAGWVVNGAANGLEYVTCGLVDWELTRNKAAEFGAEMVADEARDQLQEAYDQGEIDLFEYQQGVQSIDANETLLRQSIVLGMKEAHTTKSLHGKKITEVDPVAVLYQKTFNIDGDFQLKFDHDIDVGIDFQHCLDNDYSVETLEFGVGVGLKLIYKDLWWIEIEGDTDWFPKSEDDPEYNVQGGFGVLF